MRRSSRYGERARVRISRRPSLPRVFTGRDAVAAGALTEAQLRGPVVQRLVRGVYAPAGLPVTHELRCEAVGLLLPPGGVLTGRSAATASGVPLADRDDPVTVLLPAGGPDTLPRGVDVRLAQDVVASRRWRTTRLAVPERIAFDLCSRAPLPDGVALLDAFARAGGFDPASFRAWVDVRHDPWVRPARRAAELCDPRAESQPESRLRVHLLLAGLDVEPAVTVLDAGGRFIARVDLAVRGARVAVEYDGRWHALREALESDRRRITALRDAGWEVVHVTAGSLRDPGEVVDAVRRAVARQAARGLVLR